MAPDRRRPRAATPPAPVTTAPNPTTAPSSKPKRRAAPTKCPLDVKHNWNVVFRGQYVTPTTREAILLRDLQNEDEHFTFATFDPADVENPELILCPKTHLPLPPCPNGHLIEMELPSSPATTMVDSDTSLSPDSTADEPDHIPRPPNTFLLYRIDMSARLKSVPQSSRVAGKELNDYWQEASTDHLNAKGYYDDLSKIFKAIHGRMHPNYTYRPRKPGIVQEERERKAAERLELKLLNQQKTQPSKRKRRVTPGSLAKQAAIAQGGKGGDGKTYYPPSAYGPEGPPPPPLQVPPSPRPVPQLQLDDLSNDVHEAQYTDVVDDTTPVDWGYPTTATTGFVGTAQPHALLPQPLDPGIIATAAPWSATTGQNLELPSDKASQYAAGFLLGQQFRQQQAAGVAAFDPNHVAAPLLNLGHDVTFQQYTAGAQQMGQYAAYNLEETGEDPENPRTTPFPSREEIHVTLGAQDGEQVSFVATTTPAYGAVADARLEPLPEPAPWGDQVQAQTVLPQPDAMYGQQQQPDAAFFWAAQMSGMMAAPQQQQPQVPVSNDLGAGPTYFQPYYQPVAPVPDFSQYINPVQEQPATMNPMWLLPDHNAQYQYQYQAAAPVKEASPPPPPVNRASRPRPPQRHHYHPYQQ